MHEQQQQAQQVQPWPYQPGPYLSRSDTIIINPDKNNNSTIINPDKNNNSTIKDATMTDATMRGIQGQAADMKGKSHCEYRVCNYW
jgi:hypothetical protein